MSAGRYLFVQYCDDIRQEVGNKLSLIGCYGSELLVEKLPAVLPKLCVQAHLSTPLDQPLERVTLRAYINGDVLAELELPVAELNARPRPVDTAATRMNVGAIISLTPFIFDKEGVVRIEAETESGIVKGGRLRLMLNETHKAEQATLIGDHREILAAK